ncbi:uncharacterized protein LOC133881128 [Alnus glutinosa]|uniref:uncharacterized protein LOC133881128 n=1 Tax=Alnus glutinosa TaxID=3517 RepID=UPI002D78EC97|nr:uncharacterized protein LOC133881128 [Alnus glutinosa]
MVTTRRSNPVQNETQGEVQPTNRDDVHGEAESAATQTQPPFNHNEVEGTNPDGNPEGSGERAVQRNEDHVEPANPVPPTDSERRLQKMKRDGKESLIDNLFQHKESIFTEVSNFDLPRRFKVPDIPVFSGSEDPVEHLDNFRSHVSLHKTPDAVACRAFPLPLSGKARDWLRNLPPRSIDRFDALGRKFLAQFMSRRVPTLCAAGTERVFKRLFMEIQPGETGDRKRTRRLHLRCNFPRVEERQTADGGLGVETTEGSSYLYGKDGEQQHQPSTKKPKNKKNPQPIQDAGPGEYKKAKKNFRDYKWTPLNASLIVVLMELRKDPNYQRPRPIPGDPPWCLAHKYCAFHDSYGHLIEQCVSLRQLIEKFIENGKLVRFLVNERNQQERDQYPWPRREEDRNERRNYQPRQEERRGRSREPAPRPRRDERRERSRSRAQVEQQGNLPIIHTISGGFGGGGESNSARKAYTRQLDDFELYSVQKPPKFQKYNPLIIGFSDDDYAGVSLPHIDALVITLTIANYQTRRILVDTGSSVDILFKSAFDHMEVPRGKVVPVSCQLQGFAGEKVLPLGSVDLPVTAGTYPRQKVIMVKFLIVDKVSAYNAIIRRTALNELKAVTSTPHLSMKFSTEEGVGVVNGDQKEARRCYNLSLKDTLRQHNLDEKAKEDGK